MPFFKLVMALGLAMLFAGSGMAAEIESTLKQRDWMVNLVDALGWSFGLPDNPEDADYLKILEGSRNLRIEAEENHQPDDRVSVKSYATFGPFSGTGWLSGISTPTQTHLRFFLPLGGTYSINAALRLAGHQIELAGQTFTANGQDHFTLAELGAIDLEAGAHELTIQIPPNGAVDYLELKAPSLAAIHPLPNWNLDQPLSWEDLAVTAVQALQLQSLLPSAKPLQTIEAESAPPPQGAEITDIRHLGEPSQGRWVRAGPHAVSLDLPFRISRQGFYSLKLKGTGETPLGVALNGQPARPIQFPAFLEDRVLGDFFLEPGINHLQLDLPPRGGIDLLEIVPKKSNPDDFLNLVGLQGQTGRPSEAKMNEFLSLLAALAAGR